MCSLVHRSCQEPAPVQALHGATVSLRHIHLLWRGVLPWAAGRCLLHHGSAWAAEVHPPSPWSSPRAAGESALVPRASCPPLSAVALMSVELFLSHVLTPVSPTAFFLFAFLNYVIPEVLPLLLMGLASGGSVLGPTWLCQTLGKLLTPSHRSHPCSPPATKTLLCKPTTGCTLPRQSK